MSKPKTSSVSPNVEDGKSKLPTESTYKGESMPLGDCTATDNTAKKKPSEVQIEVKISITKKEEVESVSKSRSVRSSGSTGDGKKRDLKISASSEKKIEEINKFVEDIFLGEEAASELHTTPEHSILSAAAEKEIKKSESKVITSDTQKEPVEEDTEKVQDTSSISVSERKGEPESAVPEIEVKAETKKVQDTSSISASERKEPESAVPESEKAETTSIAAQQEFVEGDEEPLQSIPSLSVTFSKEKDELKGVVTEIETEIREISTEKVVSEGEIKIEKTSTIGKQEFVKVGEETLPSIPSICVTLLKENEPKSVITEIETKTKETSIEARQESAKIDEEQVQDITSINATEKDGPENLVPDKEIKTETTSAKEEREPVKDKAQIIPLINVTLLEEKGEVKSVVTDIETKTEEMSTEAQQEIMKGHEEKVQGIPLISALERMNESENLIHEKEMNVETISTKVQQEVVKDEKNVEGIPLTNITHLEEKGELKSVVTKRETESKRRFTGTQEESVISDEEKVQGIPSISVHLSEEKDESKNVVSEIVEETKSTTTETQQEFVEGDKEKARDIPLISVLQEKDDSKNVVLDKGMKTDPTSTEAQQEFIDDKGEIIPLINVIVSEEKSKIGFSEELHLSEINNPKKECRTEVSELTSLSQTSRTGKDVQLPLELKDEEICLTSSENVTIPLHTSCETANFVEQEGFMLENRYVSSKKASSVIVSIGDSPQKSSSEAAAPTASKMVESSTIKFGNESDFTIASQSAMTSEFDTTKKESPEFECPPIDYDEIRRKIEKHIAEGKESEAKLREGRSLVISSPPDHIDGHGEANIAAKHPRFHILLDVSQFSKESITINAVRETIDVYAKQESKEPGHEFHELHQIFQIPVYVDDSQLSASIIENNMLLLEAPLKQEIIDAYRRKKESNAECGSDLYPVTFSVDSDSDTGTTRNVSSDIEDDKPEHVDYVGQKELKLYGQVKKRLRIRARNYIPKNKDPIIFKQDRRFNIYLDVSQFERENITVTVSQKNVIIYASQKDVNEFGEQFHELQQTLAVPTSVDDASFSAIITDNGMLIIGAALKEYVETCSEPKSDKITEL